jgi:hypothetical protein
MRLAAIRKKQAIPTDSPTTFIKEKSFLFHRFLIAIKI